MYTMGVWPVRDSSSSKKAEAMALAWALLRPESSSMSSTGRQS